MRKAVVTFVVFMMMAGSSLSAQTDAEDQERIWEVTFLEDTMIGMKIDFFCGVYNCSETFKTGPYTYQVRITDPEISQMPGTVSSCVPVGHNSQVTIEDRLSRIVELLESIQRNLRRR